MANTPQLTTAQIKALSDYMKANQQDWIISLTAQLNGGHNGNRKTSQAVHGGSNQAPGGGPGTSPPGAVTYTIVSLAEDFPRPDSTPHEGIRAGEVIGWRLWKLKKGFLHSITADKMWNPGEPMEGSVDAFDIVYAVPMGIYAMKHLYPVAVLAIEETFVFGSVEMWGEVVEHEHGYRAQFASVRSLNFLCDLRVTDAEKEIQLTLLRERYGVAG